MGRLQHFDRFKLLDPAPARSDAMSRYALQRSQSTASASRKIFACVTAICARWGIRCCRLAHRGSCSPRPEQHAICPRCTAGESAPTGASSRLAVFGMASISSATAGNKNGIADEPSMLHVNAEARRCVASVPTARCRAPSRKTSHASRCHSSMPSLRGRQCLDHHPAYARALISGEQVLKRRNCRAGSADERGASAQSPTYREHREPARTGAVTPNGQRGKLLARKFPTRRIGRAPPARNGRRGTPMPGVMAPAEVLR